MRRLIKYMFIYVYTAAKMNMCSITRLMEYISMYQYTWICICILPDDGRWRCTLSHVWWSTYSYTYVLYVCMKIRACVYVHTNYWPRARRIECMLVHICTCMYENEWMNIYMYAQTHVYAGTSDRVHIHIYTCINVCLRIHIYMYICTRKHMYMYAQPRYMRGALLLEQGTSAHIYAYTYIQIYIYIYIYIRIYVCVCKYIYTYIYVPASTSWIRRRSTCDSWAEEAEGTCAFAYSKLSKVSSIVSLHCKSSRAHVFEKFLIFDLLADSTCALVLWILPKARSKLDSLWKIPMEPEASVHLRNVSKVGSLLIATRITLEDCYGADFWEFQKTKEIVFDFPCRWGRKKWKFDWGVYYRVAKTDRMP